MFTFLENLDILFLSFSQKLADILESVKFEEEVY